MRKLWFAAALACAVAVGGCAQFQAVVNAGSLVTASVTNPVTPTRLYEAENAMTIAFAALGAYKNACSRGAADVNCRANVAKIQVYTRQLPPLLARLRVFVKTNDQINAIGIYNEVVAVIADFKKAAADAGVPVGGA